MRVSAVLALASASVAFAQNSSKVYTADDLGAWAGEVSDSQKRNWCLGQRNTCRELCNSRPDSNDCETETLDFECTCEDGSTPPLNEYSATVPSYICAFVFERCTASRPNDLDGQQECEDARNASCDDTKLKSSADGNTSGGSSSDDSSATTTVTSTSTSSGSSESTGDASATNSADGAEATGEGDDDSFAAPAVAPMAGAAAAAMGLMAFLV